MNRPRPATLLHEDRRLRLLALGACLATLCFLAFTAFASAAQAAPATWRVLGATGPTDLPPATSEIQQVAVNAEGGTFTLSFEGQATAPISFDAEASEVRAALDAMLTAVSPGGSVRVAGGPGNPGAELPYSVAFAGSLAGTDVAQLTGDPASLTGSSPGVTVTTKVQGGGAGTGQLAAYATNVAVTPTSSPVTMTIELPMGITLASAPQQVAGEGWSCPGAEARRVTCTATTAIGPTRTANPVVVPLTVSGAAGHSVARISVQGGGVLAAGIYEEPITVSYEPAQPGVQAFWGGAFKATGEPDTTAGDHPSSAITGFLLDTVLSPGGQVVPAGDPKDIAVNLPPGFLGDPLVTPRCPQEARTSPFSPELCTVESKVGTIQLGLEYFGGQILLGSKITSIFNDVAPQGAAAGFAFIDGQPEQALVGSLRSDEDYGVTITSPNTVTFDKTYGSFVALEGGPSGAAGKAFLRNPTDCGLEAQEAGSGLGPLTTISANSWQLPGAFSQRISPQPAVTGCDRLQFQPRFSFRPAESTAATGTAATADLHVPQEGLTNPAKLATPDLKKTVVALPRGLTLNPSAAEGLQACSEAQVGFEGAGYPMPNPLRFDEAPVSCPEASKLGTVEVASPLLEEKLEGTIYLAAQEENPFDSLLALYLVVESKRFGITLKLPGEVKPDPTTGRLTAVFDDNPQLPFEDLELHFRGGGPRSPLATPAVCGTYTTHGELTPWSAPESGPPAQTEDSFQITAGAGGGACATSESGLPFSPSFEAGTGSTQAGAYAPLVIRVARKDGEQELTHLNFTLPPGLTGRLAGIPYCPDSAIAAAAGKSGRTEQASPSCPAASELGTVDASAGVGSEPIHVGGHLYLAGPYKGAPLSAVVITPAVAGPFDLGDVVVRAALEVNPETTQITAVSDEVPHILKGIPLQLRSVEIKVGRDGFTLNPTSCDPMGVTSSLGGLNGGAATPSTRFQVGNCGALAFRPNLKVRLKGATGRTGHPALKAVVTTKPGEADIGRAQVNLPHSEFLDQGDLNNTCTKPVLLAGNCPASTIYGKARAWTPLLEKPLQGNVYLVGGYGYKLPALVADLNGQIRVTLVGKVDSGKNKGIRNTFEVVPDAPISRFVLEMKGGKKYGLLQNSEPLCKISKAKRRAIVRFTGQNGKVHAFRPVVANQCKKHKRPKKPHTSHHRADGHGAKQSSLRRVLRPW